ncbi:hypothetical protein CPB84DRAFT_1842065 [Gymnopilus junonius]|uniref:Uncharacterized protein n=1 Tax=Gymnopilus junonius TaxID=109634 RepID=A0A9P5P0N7_GYMJU|nr:hypothetical protein CPB84DRAFT_1842065 [Gymnopilus junonius]
MRAACDIYEHPVLSSSEVWAKDAHNRSGKTRFIAAVGIIYIAAITTVAAGQFLGYIDLRALHSRCPSVVRPAIPLPLFSSLAIRLEYDADSLDHYRSSLLRGML